MTDRSYFLAIYLAFMAFCSQCAEIGIIYPLLGNELKLPLDVGVEADEMEAALAAIVDQGVLQAITI